MGLEKVKDEKLMTTRFLFWGELSNTLALNIFHDELSTGGNALYKLN